MKLWRFHDIKISVYIDHGLGSLSTRVSATRDAKFVKNTLKKGGFTANLEKLA